MTSDASRFIVRTAAEADIEEAALWYELRSLGLGTDFLRAVDVCFERIRRSPESFQQIYKSARRARIPRFPYVAYFVLLELHAKRQVGNAHELLQRWNALHAMRTGLSIVAFVLVLLAVMR